MVQALIILVLVVWGLPLGSVALMVLLTLVSRRFRGWVARTVG